MQADLCDNCRTAAGDGDEGHDGWIRMAKFKMHTGPHEVPPNLPPPLAAMLEQRMEEVPPHLCPTQYDLCSDRCAAAFVSNGYKPNVEGLFDDISVADFVEASTAPPPEDDTNG